MAMASCAPVRVKQRRELADSRILIVRFHVHRERRHHLEPPGCGRRMLQRARDVFRNAYDDDATTFCGPVCVCVGFFAKGRKSA